MTSLFSLTSIYVALISYWLWDEKLHIFHLYGMIFLVACALLISFSKEAVSITDVESDDISPLWSVLFSILSTMWFLVRTIGIKIWYKKFNVDPLDLTVASYMVQGVVFTIVVFSMELASYEVMRDNMIAGFSGFVGHILINHATTKGFGGPAVSLTNIQVVLQVTFNALALSQVPNGMQIGAWVWGILGSLTITLGPMTWNKLKQKWAKKDADSQWE
jgi:drug/metabolite transporter (DMT)-like permease